jgi:hypothetical protein
MTNNPKKRRLFSIRVDQITPELIDSIAKEFGCKRIDGKGVIKGSAGVLLDKIAQGRLRIISTTPD